MALSCGGASTPAAPTPTPVPSLTPAPTPIPTPTSSAGCAFGYGTLETSCARRTAQLLGDVNAAIERVLQQHPEYFNTSDTNGPGGYRVLRRHDYHVSVVSNLQQAGFCAETDDDTVALKNGNEFSETYNILLSSGHIRRGDSGYRDTCSPPNFPINPPDAIAYVRVAFYSITCEEGITPPRNGDNVLPIGCRGFITATPKQRNNEDVPHDIIGNDISWRLEQSGDAVLIQDFENNAFNKIATGLNAGRYRLCAVSHGVEGCQDAEILRDPRR